ncbi:MAG: HAD-superfamily hydrolase-like protein [Clostridiales bacterium 38_11]|nr:MAG: HAD-superfamily hydrolase-like protein [Clostridiales bacterium 38_11]HBH13396.1 hypothetical protein [Clostridiales bacterium]
MKKINLCIDIDSTLTTPDYWVTYANTFFGTDYVYHDDTVEGYFKDNEFINKRFDDFYHRFAEDMHRNARIRPDAVEVINQLRKICNIYYVTARESHIENITIEWLKKHGILSEVFHLGSFYKNKKAKELNCDIFIEDNLETAKQLVEEGITVLLIDTGFNRYEKLPNMTRVFNWQEIYHFIGNYQNGDKL